MLKVLRYRTKLLLLAFIFAFIGSHSTKAQHDPFYSQYYLNPMIINPGFTGFGNTLSADLTVRQQWMGIEGAPNSLYFSLHSPLNRTRVSLGIDLMRSQAGPLISNHVGFNYSYMVRLADRVLMSLGMGVGVNQQALDFTDVVLANKSDPNFALPYMNQLVPVASVGGVVLTPIFYFSLSSPSIPLTYVNMEPDNSSSQPLKRHYYFTAGVTAPSLYKFVAKFSAMCRYVEKEDYVIDNTFQLIYKDFIGVGFNYRYANSYGAILRINANRNLSLVYSYDVPMAKEGYFTEPSHEITLSYDNFKLYKRNKYRNFKRKKEVEEEAYKSIRYF